MKEEIKNRVIEHGERLKTIFNLNPNIDALSLCKRLRRLEAQAHKITEDYCNIPDTDLSELETILIKVNTILLNENQKIPVFINQDPRGYALKIKSEYINKNKINIFRDFGGYGIIAPDLTGGF